MVDPYPIIRTYYPEGSTAARVLIIHSESVARKAVGIARALGLSQEEVAFIHEASLLHDIGMFLTHAPEIGCHGVHPYICHGYLGHDLLVSEGLPQHALVCERHTGTGLTLADMESQNLPLPRRMMVPLSLCEKVVAYSDKFFSKNLMQLGREKSLEEVLCSMRRFGPDKEATIREWHRQFGI